MSIKINFGDYAVKTNETLIQRIQFVFSPLNELFRSLHILLNSRHHGMNIEWALQAQRQLSHGFYNNLHYFSPIYELGVPPFFLNDFQRISYDLDSEIHQLRNYAETVDTAGLSNTLKGIQAERDNEFIPALAKNLEWSDFDREQDSLLADDLLRSPRTVFLRLFQFIDDYRKSVFDDTWKAQSVQSRILKEIKEQTVYLKSYGFAQMINHLQIDRLQWRNNTLIVTKPFQKEINLGDDGSILLIPSLFTWPHLFVDSFSGGAVLTYDASNQWELDISVDERNLNNIFHALNDPIRLKIMKYLQKKASTTQALSQMLVMSPSSVSHHLQILKEAGLVSAAKERKFVLYTVTNLINDIIPNFYHFLYRGEG